jgi:hypothetical protein
MANAMFFTEKKKKKKKKKKLETKTKCRPNFREQKYISATNKYRIKHLVLQKKEERVGEMLHSQIQTSK